MPLPALERAALTAVGRLAATVALLEPPLLALEALALTALLTTPTDRPLETLALETPADCLLLAELRAACTAVLCVMLLTSLY